MRLEAVAAALEACPRWREHIPGPRGYLAWHEWARRKHLTHRQRRCDCGLYVIWTPRGDRPLTVRGD